MSVGKTKYLPTKGIMTPKKIIKVTVVLVGVVVAIALMYARVGAMDSFTCDGAPHQVNYGDTLWKIAEAKCDGNIQVVVDNLVDTYGTIIQPNQDIWLPLGDECLLENRDGQVYDVCG